MSGLFNPENKIWTGLSTAADLMLLNIMWFISCIPIITIGVATTSYYYTVHKVIRNQKSGIWTEYWSSFKSNFKQATQIWLIFLAIFVVLGLDIAICTPYLEAGEKIGNMVFFFYILLGINLVWFMYVFAYLARFEDTNKVTLKNAAGMAFLNLPSSLLVMVIMAVTVYFFRYPALFIWFVPAIAMMLLNRILERVFRKYMLPEDLAEEEENDKMRC